ncbi:MAG TPA: hypothetical protein VKF36_06900 [Syntrophorhabdales bacterium]|nr:hypothetical protein [Syntrophorhabdales bacterium]
MADENGKVEKLKRACGHAFVIYGHSCSHAVWYVISQYEPSQKWMAANDLITNLSTSPKWKPVDQRELSMLASQGVLIVGGLNKVPAHGHVLVVYPGPQKSAGGYNAKDDAGKIYKVQPRGSYPLAMSTSSGGWPGARSYGDKTVWDSWGKDTEFKKVRFWKYVGSGTAGGNV